MNVLYLTDRLSRRGGADLHLAQVVGWAVAQGYEVTMACGRIERDARVPGGVRVTRVRGLASAVASTGRLAGLDQLISAAEVVHVQNVMNPHVLRDVAATGRAIVTVQDHRVFCPGIGKTLPDGRMCTSVMSRDACTACVTDRRYLARMLRLTDARREAMTGCRLVVLSQWMAEQLADVGTRSVRVIPPWVEPGPASHRPRRGVVMAGRLVLHKGVADGWRAWREADCGEPLTVAGEGPLAESLVGADVIGWISSHELRRLMANAIVVLFPSLWQEPFGMVGVEALAESTPVVVTESGGVGEWADQGCVRVPPGDVVSMAAAIRQLVNRPDAAHQLGLEGRSMVRTRFARAPIEALLRELYLETASS